MARTRDVTGNDCGSEVFLRFVGPLKTEHIVLAKRFSYMLV